MTPEELDQWRGREARRLRREYPEEATEVIAARLAREGRTPPEPEPVDPDVLAFREWESAQWPAYTCTQAAFLAGARMATERERERAKVLVEYIQGYACPESVAAAALARYRGEA